MTAARYGVVVPTLGRPSLGRLLAGLAAQHGPAPEQVVVVDDRPDAAAPLAVPAGVEVLRGGGRGPAAARNLGWRHLPTDLPWVAFLDDDVELPPGWARALATDLAAAGPRTAGSQGRVVVPRPQGRRPTDWERSTAGLEGARWATADMAYRRRALVAVHGFDERFPRAYREDADLALRLRRSGWELAVGDRHVRHPVRPADRWVSLRAQRGNADDALMRRLHGPGWRHDAGCGRGRLPLHLLTTAAGLVATAGLVAGGAGALTATHEYGRQARPWALAAAAAWLALTTDFAARRIAAGPRTRDEVVAMLATSAAIPPAAVWHRLRGALAHRRAQPWPPVEAVLLDRDGTLVVDVPYNGDPDRVVLAPGAAQAVARLRRSGVRLGVVTNQSGVARGLIRRADVEAVNARVESLLGPFETWQVCEHGDGDGCGCRKPAPGMVVAAASALGVPPERCVVIGDTGADVGAALAAGARAVLVPTSVTRQEEVLAAPRVAASLPEAVELVLAGVA